MRQMFKLLSENRGKGFFRVENAAQETTIYLYDAIVGTDLEAEYWGGVSAETLVKTIRAVTTPVINLRVNSPGGDVFAARAIEQALRDNAARVVAHIDGYAASAARFMVMAADQIIMAKGAFLMIHKAWTIAIGNADDMTAQAALLDKLDGTLAETYAARSGMEAAQVMAMMAAETWFTADEAITAKLADAIAEDAPKNTSRAAWNMSAYGNAPPCDAPPAPPPAPAPAANDDATPTSQVFSAHHSEDLRRRLRIASKTA